MDLKIIFDNKPLFATRKVGSEMILVPVKKSVADMNEIFTLNELGRFIWERIDGEKGQEQIIVEITEEFEVDADTAKRDMEEFLTRLSELMEKC